MNNKPDIERIRLNLARRHLLDFAEDTDARYQANWHHKLLCEYLDRFADNEIRRLMVFMPPRHGKSELVSRKLPAFIFGRNPDAAIIATSYSADLAQRMNRDVQRIMSGDEYRRVFPGSMLFSKNIRTVADNIYLRNADIFEIVGHSGSYRGAGVGGGITGMGGNYIIIDDPVKNREEANSAVYRDKLWDWYTSTLYTRQEKDAGILVTLTRWHEDDLAGRLLEAAKTEGGDKWEIVIMPAIRESGDAAYDPRAEGEPLWADKYGLQSLLTIKATIGSYEWSALYQQRPSPGEGGLFKREWWQRWKELPGDLFDFIQSWDCAFKDSDSSDYVVGQVWARSKKHPANRYLLDQKRGRMTFTETVNAVRELSGKWKQTTRKLIEDKANGAAVMDVLKKEIHGIIPVEPKGGKIVRANAVTAVVEAGNVFIPDATVAHWIGDFVEEFAAFPNGRHDDQVDAMTQANAYYNDKGSWNFRNLL
jgi:predicted phage terminase large subunit-like protein